MNPADGSVYRFVLRAIFRLGVLNFLTMWALSFVFGDAWYGLVENGHYYLAKHASHRDPIEVSATIFSLSLLHVKSQFVTVPLSMLAAWLLNASKSPQSN